MGTRRSRPSIKMGCGRARGVRRNTRDMFSKGFGNHGLPSMKTYLTQYKVGDFVDIKVNGAIHKGMPYRYYHGRTGRVWNVTKAALGVLVNKQLKGRIIHRLHVPSSTSSPPAARRSSRTVSLSTRRSRLRPRRPASSCARSSACPRIPSLATSSRLRSSPSTSCAPCPTSFWHKRLVRDWGILVLASNENKKRLWCSYVHAAYSII